MNYESMKFNQSIENDEELIKREHIIEYDAVICSQSAIEERLATRGYDSTTQGKRALRDAIEALKVCIEKWIEKQVHVSRKNKLYKYLSLFDSYTVAYLVAKDMLYVLTVSQADFIASCRRIGNRLKDLYDFTVLSESGPGEVKRLEGRLRHIQKEHIKLKVFKDFVKSSDLVGAEWPEEDKLALANLLINMFCEETKLVVIENKVRKNSIKQILTPAANVNEFIKSAIEADALLMPFHFPMVIPPEDWKDVHSGGYLDKKQHSISLVKTHRKDILAALDNTEMPQVFQAVNTIQATPWRINKKVYAVFKELSVNKKISFKEEQWELPAKPWPKMSPTQWKRFREENPRTVSDWKKEAAKVRKLQAQQVSAKCVIKQQRLIAEKFLNDKAIYYPHTFDFRGRIYPVTGLGAINPQGQDSGKALIEFAVGKPLGESGGYWLCVHLTNCWGNDKISLDDRVLAAMVNAEDYKAYAADPVNKTGWMSADKPWQFLAACFEFVEFLKHGDSFVSHLPIAQDGTCSGLQHFAAMLKHEETAKAVNVVQESDKPADVYQKVADKVKEKLVKDGSALAKEWLPRLNRSLVKRNVMTTPYGVTTLGMFHQIEDEIKDQISKGKMRAFEGNFNEALQYITPFILEAIHETITAAYDCMDWLKEVTRVYSQSGQALCWTTPSGFVVYQAYKELIAKQVNIFYRGRRIRFTLSKEGEKLDKRKQVASVAANYVHSLDAAHLVKTVNQCMDNGIDSLAMIHDSFSTHAADTDDLGYILRNTFVEQYSGNVLQDFYNEICSSLPVELSAKIPVPPACGSLDIKQVINSDYFFA